MGDETGVAPDPSPATRRLHVASQRWYIATDEDAHPTIAVIAERQIL